MKPHYSIKKASQKRILVVETKFLENTLNEGENLGELLEFSISIKVTVRKKVPCLHGEITFISFAFELRNYG